MRALSRSNAAARALAPKINQIITQLEISNAEIVELKTQLQVASETIESLNSAVNPLRQATTIDFYTMIDNQLTKVEDMTLKVNQSLPLTLTILDAQGNPASVDGVPGWALTDTTKGALTVAADGLSASFVPAGPLGTCTIQVTADADLGAGVVEIIGTLDLDLIAAQAVSVTIVAGTPVDII